jgi:hypothetical protein
LRTAEGFVQWADAFLRDNPPTEVFYPGVGIGVRLGDNAMVSISGPARIADGGDAATTKGAGQMQPDMSISITKGQSPITPP